MSAQLIGEGEPLAAFSALRILPVPLLLDGSAAALEGQELLVADARQPLTRAPARSDLHAAVVSQVVDDVDSWQREVAVGDVSVAPAAGSADPGIVHACAGAAPAEVAGTGKAFVRRHSSTLRPSTDTTDGVSNAVEDRDRRLVS